MGLKHLSKTEKSMSKGESTTVYAKIVNIDWTRQFIAPAREKEFESEQDEKWQPWRNSAFEGRRR